MHTLCTQLCDLAQELHGCRQPTSRMHLQCCWLSNAKHHTFQARGGDVIGCEHTEGLHLVEHWIVGLVDGVAAVHIAGDQEALVALSEDLCLMRGRVASANARPDQLNQAISLRRTQTVQQDL